MDADAYPNLDNFKLIKKIGLDIDPVWIGTLKLSGTLYRAAYKEKRDILELNRYKKRYMLTPILRKVDKKYVLIIESESNTLLTLGKNNELLDSKVLEKDDYGIYFK